jgi:hypothetical protein
MTDVPSSRPRIGEAAALRLVGLFKQVDGKLEHWAITDATQRKVVIRHVNSMVYECRDVIPIIGKISDAPAKHLVLYWPKFVAAWKAQEIGGPGNLAFDILSQELIPAASKLTIRS